MKNTIHFILNNKSFSRKSLVGVSAREAISTGRLNYTESMELQPFTPGLNISWSLKETNNAGIYGYICTCNHQRSRTAATYDFKDAGTFLLWKKQSIGMCHKPRCHVNYILLLQWKQIVIEPPAGNGTAAAAYYSSCFHDDNGHGCQCGGIHEPLSGLGLTALY